MIGKVNRRDILKTSAALAACYGAAGAPLARAVETGRRGAESFSAVDSLLQAATRSGELPGIVALAATDGGIVYEGVFGKRRLPDGPAMTRDTVFGIASMVKLITSKMTKERLLKHWNRALKKPGCSSSWV